VHLSFALSITHFFSSVGGDAGFAALVGLAILVLLYFAHARETSTLRDQLEAAMQRLEELERRLVGGAAPSTGARQPASTMAKSTAPVAAPPAAASRSGSPPAPAGASPGPAGGQPSSVPPPVSVRPLSAPPAVPPAGMGAPPLSDATRAVPSAPDPANLPDDPPSVPRGRTALAGDGRDKAPSPAPGTTPSPVTAAAGGNGFPAAPATGGARAPKSLLEHGLPGRGRVPGWVIPVAAVVLVAVIAVVLVLVLVPGTSQHKTAAVHRHHPDIAATPSGVVASSVTVAVVNATSINQLAHHIADRLTASGFKEGTLATASNQSGAATAVHYLPGHRNDALAVAHVLKLPASAVRPATQSSEGLVCPSPSSCDDDVIVVAGSNLAPKH